MNRFIGAKQAFFAAGAHSRRMEWRRHSGSPGRNPKPLSPKGCAEGLAALGSWLSTAGQAVRCPAKPARGRKGISHDFSREGGIRSVGCLRIPPSHPSSAGGRARQRRGRDSQRWLPSNPALSPVLRRRTGKAAERAGFAALAAFESRPLTRPPQEDGQGSGEGGILSGLFSTVSDCLRFLTQVSCPSTTCDRWLVLERSGPFWAKSGPFSKVSAKSSEAMPERVGLSARARGAARGIAIVPPAAVKGGAS